MLDTPHLLINEYVYAMLAIHAASIERDNRRHGRANCRTLWHVASSPLLTGPYTTKNPALSPSVTAEGGLLGKGFRILDSEALGLGGTQQNGVGRN
jgi:hypothetical protein